MNIFLNLEIYSKYIQFRILDVIHSIMYFWIKIQLSMVNLKYVILKCKIENLTFMRCTSIMGCRKYFLLLECVSAFSCWALAPN